MFTNRITVLYIGIRDIISVIQIYRVRYIKTGLIKMTMHSIILFLLCRFQAQDIGAG